MPKGDFDDLNAKWDAKGFTKKSLTLAALREFPTMGNPVVLGAQTIRYEKYPADAPFPLTWFAFLAGTALWGLYDGAASHWGTSKLSTSSLWIFDVAFVMAMLGMLADTVVTAAGTYTGYLTVEGLELNGHLRQWGAWLSENLGVNFAWALLLTDFIEGAMLLGHWYYGKKQRNVVSLVSMAFLGGAHWYFGWASWHHGVKGTLAALPLVLQQLAGAVPRLEFQGGGPQYVVGVI